MVGIFFTDAFGVKDSASCVYIKMASVFLCTVAFMLCWYVSNLIIRRDVLRRTYDFGLAMLNVNFEKISQNNLQKLAHQASRQFEKYEAYQFEFLGYCLPLLALFLALFIMSIYRTPNTILTYFISCPLIFILIKLAYSIAGNCHISKRSRELQDSLDKLAFSARGIQYYGSMKFIQSKLRKAKIDFIRASKERIANAIWKSFSYICLTFFVIVIIYISNKEYICTNLFKLEGVYELYLMSMFVFVLFLMKFFHYNNKRHIEFENITKYQLTQNKENSSQKEIDKKNLFIAFHGVYFQDPAMLSKSPEIRDLTFSILPGEFIAITGENFKAMRYIFDLLLRFYKPQSGQIYLSGTKIENIPKEQLRSLIGIFEEDFGLVDGSVQDNLEIVTDNFDKILAVSENVGLSDFLETGIYHNSEYIQLSQETLFRLQIARLAIQNPEIMLINTPKVFETSETERMFYDFVDYSTKKHTVILITGRISPIIYANKILFITKDYSLFGSHAELSRNMDYQKYIGDKEQ